MLLRFFTDYGNVWVPFNAKVRTFKYANRNERFPVASGSRKPSKLLNFIIIAGTPQYQADSAYH